MSRLVAAVLLMSVASANAADRLVAGKRVVLQSAGDRSLLSLVLRDPNLPLPTIGGPDDPRVAGLRLQVFSNISPSAPTALVVPPGSDWTVRTGARPVWTWKNPDAPDGPSWVRSVRYVPGKVVEIVARRFALAMGGALRAVGVRIEMGDTRVCAVFDGDAVRRDVPGRFVGRDADVPGATSCSDGVVAGVACTLVGATCDGLCDPGGGTCGGTPQLGCVCLLPGEEVCDHGCPDGCPGGQTCANVGGVPFQSCGCVPVGSVGCGETYPTCGGGCPTGTQCMDDTMLCCGGLRFTGCSCLTPSGP